VAVTGMSDRDFERRVKAKAAAAAVLLFTQPGVPLVYYGQRWTEPTGTRRTRRRRPIG